MLFLIAKEEHEEDHVHERVVHLRHFFAFQFYQTHPSCVEILLVLMDLSRTEALSFQMYSLSKDIYDK